MRVLIDVDEVIADFSGYFVKTAEYILNRKLKIINPNSWSVKDSYNLSSKDLNRVYFTINSERTALNLDIFPESKENVIKLFNNHDVWFVTAPLVTNKTWEYDRRKWFDKHFPTNFKEKIIFTEDKSIISGDLLIDDKLLNLEAWKLNNKGTPILWGRDNNKKYKDRCIRVESWEEVFSFIEENAK